MRYLTMAATLSVLFLTTAPACSRGCVRSCDLDPVESDLRHFLSQRNDLADKRRALSARMKEFDDKVFVNQEAAADLLRTDLVARTDAFAKRYRQVSVKSRSVTRVYRRELAGYQTLARAYHILLDGLSSRNPAKIRKGLRLKDQGARQIKGAVLALQKLERKFRKR